CFAFGAKCGPRWGAACASSAHSIPARPISPKPPPMDSRNARRDGWLDDCIVARFDFSRKQPGINAGTGLQVPGVDVSAYSAPRIAGEYGGYWRADREAIRDRTTAGQS